MPIFEDLLREKPEFEVVSADFDLDPVIAALFRKQILISENQNLM